MNQLNYASFEASRRLVDNGIVLETDFYRCISGDPSRFYSSENKSNWLDRIGKDMIPVPSPAEIWRKLPDGVDITKSEGKTCGLICYGKKSFDTENINLTDVLIDLLIWMRKDAK